MMNYPLFFPMGALAAHTAAGSAGFRQKEVRFFSELFSNWIQLGGIGAVHLLHNTQVSRFMEHLVSDSQARRTSKGAHGTYRLTRAGLFSLVTNIVTPSYLSERAQCSLVWYFLKSYAPQIREGMAAAGEEFSRAHKLEMETVLNADSFLKRQIQFLDYEIVRLKERVEGAHDMSKTVAKLRDNGASQQECIEAISKQYPYELNSQLSFRELLLKLPEAVITWELNQGAALKGVAIFGQLHRELTHHREHLSSLLEQQ